MAQFEQGNKRGPGRPPLTEEQKIARQALKDCSSLAEVKRKYANKFKLPQDWAAEIARAVFVGNTDAIYQIFTKALLKGDPKVFTALANRAFGMPSQEVAFSQNKPLQVEINFLGQRRSEDLSLERALGPGKAIEGAISGEVEAE